MPPGEQREKQHRINPAMRAYAQQMRRERPVAEDKLWAHLRNKQTGFRFRYQHPIGNYIADFCCSATRLIVELDGDSHAEQQKYDAKCTDWLSSAAGKCCASPTAKCSSRLPA